MLKLVNENVLPLSDALAKVTINPARILNIDVGHLTPGAPADVCIFDPDATWLVDATSLQSRGSNTPFDRHTLRGFVDTTLVAGRIIYQRRFR